MLVVHLGNLVKFSQVKYTVSESEGGINIDVIRIGAAETSFKVKVLVENETRNSIANGMEESISTCSSYQQNVIYLLYF